MLTASGTVLAQNGPVKFKSTPGNKSSTPRKAAPAVETTPAVVNPNAAIMEFENETLDYGTIKQNSDPYREFVFKNTGKEPLIITNAKGSCGCTIPDWPKEPINPGESSVIKVRYDTKRIGAFTKTITISSNAKSASKVIKIKGKVEALPSVPSEAPVKPTTPGLPVDN
ncbi:MAG: DUF1573 domain-containing protein [Flavobacteriales bacterium]|nr:DUF1573 domain-containing protein [Flavobacteriales bacterium]